MADGPTEPPRAAASRRPSEKAAGGEAPDAGTVDGDAARMAAMADGAAASETSASETLKAWMSRLSDGIAALGVDQLFKRGFLIWTGATLVLAAFAWAEARYGNLMFQRGGAVLVVYAVLVSVFSMRARVAYSDALHAIQMEQCEIAQMMHGAEHEARDETRRRLDRQLGPKLASLDIRLAEIAETNKRFQDLRTVEGPILIIGTLVWGFGDMIAAHVAGGAGG
ncbi:MAG: hypothetical protein AAF909_01050 [Pseudomonadota bacterium]